VNNKYLVQFIVYMLFGFIAMAEPGRQKQQHTGDSTAYATGVNVKEIAIDQEGKVVTLCNLPKKKQSKIRVRFRAASYFRINPDESTTPVKVSSPLHVPIGQNNRTGHIPPFYYIFLFRLTPF
jgi:hypothetical protein